MAVFKVIHENKYANKALYQNEAEVYNLIHYIYDKSIYTTGNWIVDMGANAIVQQILYCQNCKNSELYRRGIHAVLSYDTNGWEWQMNKEMVIDSVSSVEFCMNQFGLNQYQYLICVHDNGKNRHMHIYINPVNVITGNILNYYVQDYQIFLRELAKILYSKYRLALAPVSYINESGYLAFDGKGSHLYENHSHPWENILKAV